MTAEIGPLWHKFHCEIEIEIPAGANVPEAKSKAWNTVVKEVETKVKEVTGLSWG